MWHKEDFCNFLENEYSKEGEDLWETTIAP